MTRSMTLTGMLLAGLIVGGAVETAVASQARFFAGVVLAVAPAQRLVSVVEAGQAKTHETFTVPADVTVRKAGATLDLSRLKVGDPVAIEYDVRGGRAVVSTIEVITAPSP